MSSHHKKNCGRRGDGTVRSRKVNQCIDEDRRVLHKEPVRMSNLFGARWQMPFSYLTDCFMPGKMAQTYFMYFWAIVIFQFIISFIDCIFTAYVDPWWNVWVWYAIRLTLFILGGFSLFVILGICIIYSMNELDFGDRTGSGGDPTGVAIGHARSWHVLNELYVLAWYFFAVVAFLFGQAYCIERARNSEATDDVCYLAGDSTTAVAPVFTITQGISNFGVYVAFNVYGLIGIGFIIYHAIKMNYFVNNNSDDDRFVSDA